MDKTCDKLLHYKKSKPLKLFDCTKNPLDDYKYECSFQAPINIHFKEHIEQNQNIIIETYFCKNRLCEFQTYSMLIFLKHTFTCTNQCKWFQCDQCSYKSKYKHNLARHVKTVHLLSGNKTERPFQCDQCDYRAKEYKTLKRHMLIHRSDENIDWYICDECDYRAKQKTHLKEHILRKHTDTKDIQWFQCDQCTYKGKFKHILVKHVKTVHLPSGSKSETLFQCDKCAYRTKEHRCLKKHMLVHKPNENIRWFICDHCDYKAKQKIHLKEHVSRKHTKDPKDIQWFQCGHCTYKTNFKHILVRHVKRMHSVSGSKSESSFE